MSIDDVGHLHLDVVGGIAGDMFSAAMLDTFPSFEESLLLMLNDSGLHNLVTVARQDHNDGLLTGSKVNVAQQDQSGHHHHHRAWSDIRTMLEEMNLPASARQRAIDIFTRLADAEGEVHGKPADEVSFHEVGAWDSIADIVMAAWLIEQLPGVTWSCSALPVGGGQVETAHGALPVPAPATARLLEGMPLLDDGVSGERITPTGAAILANLSPDFGGLSRVYQLKGTGIGFGTKRWPGRSNVLRIVCYAKSLSAAVDADQLGVCVFEIDDQTGEDLAVALDKIRSMRGVKDVIQAPVYGKKGRLMFQVQVLVEPQQIETVTASCFTETTTLGVRQHHVQRRALQRDVAETESQGSRIRLKKTNRPLGRTVKAEMDDLAATKGGHQGREALRRTVESDD
ncbi:MAG: LarC family nickel insertion protein [Pseudomonadota bacterium]|jgi:uncharacterized protein (TIGR00299 family) protein|nr:LarC family nickel insertion protein [Pseudomonadota bacterium]